MTLIFNSDIRVLFIKQRLKKKMAGFLASFQKFSHLGEILALSSAIFWALAVILFRISGKTVHPIGLNLFKNIFSALLIILTFLALKEPILLNLPWTDYLLMGLSGLIGIALSDTLFFYALNFLGAELVAIVDCTYSPFIIGLSILFIGERMKTIQILGVLLIIFAVLLIAQKKNEETISRRKLLSGIALGILAMFFTAVGIVMVKPLLNHFSVLWASLLRLLGAIISLGIFIIFYPAPQRILRPLFSTSNLKIVIPASFLGAYLGLIAWLGGMKYTQASIASALSQMNTIFIFILAAIFLKEKITTGKIVAIVSAFSGAFLVSFFN